MKSGKALRCHYEAYKEISDAPSHRRKNGVGEKWRWGKMALGPRFGHLEFGLPSRQEPNKATRGPRYKYYLNDLIYYLYECMSLQTII